MSLSYADFAFSLMSDTDNWDEKILWYSTKNACKHRIDGISGGILRFEVFLINASLNLKPNSIQICTF
jgi:hypothetical protein